MKKENGFTLIELLAVIVILAIIALIATPIVLNLIEKARLGAAKDSAYGVRKAGQLYYQALLLDDIGGINGSITVSFDNGVITSSVNNSDVEYKLDGTIPKSGSITITNDGEISGTVIINGYTCPITNSGTISCTKGEELTPTPTPVPEPKINVTMSQNGETYLGIAYLDPTNKNTECNASIAAANVNEYGTPTEIDSGCMKWYIYAEDDKGTTDTGDDEYKAILDHNTTARVTWNGENSNVALEQSNLQAELNSLKNDSSWVLQPTIISGQEVSNIVGNTSWSDDGAWYYLDKNGTTFGTTQIANATNKSAYAWLYDYTYDCEQYGCNVQDNNTYTNVTDNSTDGTYAYWTSTPYTGNASSVWRVNRYGFLRNYDASYTSSGLRPVITFSKSDIN